MPKSLLATIQGLVLIGLLIPLFALAGMPATNSENVANDGYDVVAYFTDHAAVRGSNAFSVSHNDVIYYFANQEHRDMFQKSPVSYLPQYDGYCAFAIAKHDAKVKADPETFKMRDGKLLLFFNDFYEGQPTNTLVFWNSAEKELSAQAEKNWKTISSK